MGIIKWNFLTIIITPETNGDRLSSCSTQISQLMCPFIVTDKSHLCMSARNLEKLFHWEKLFWCRPTLKTRILITYKYFKYFDEKTV